MYRIIILFCLTVVLAACNQAPTPAPQPIATPAPDQIPLQSVNNKALPMLLIDQLIEDPGVPPYRFRLEVTDGWLKKAASAAPRSPAR
jgi:hypothetical protein